MNDLIKGRVIFKYRPEDFIVEEIGLKEISKVSETSQVFDNYKVDFGKLDINDRRNFLTFDLEKINIDHFSTMQILSKELGNAAMEIGYAGTKDKIAWTSQRISLFNADLEKIKNFKHSNLILKNFKWEKHKLKTGDLKGNKFRIVLRNADNDAIKILNRIRNSKDLPNYFGNQRFGSIRGNNFCIGKLILQKKYKDAIKEILISFGKDESDEAIKAKLNLRKSLENEYSLIKLPPVLKTEKRIIEFLSNNHNDYIGALKTIGEKTLLLLCQSVQSRVFNETLEILTENKNLNLNDEIEIVGFNSKLENNKTNHVIEKVLKKYNLKIGDFLVADLPFLSLKNSKRKAFLNAKDIIVLTLEDEVFTGTKKIVLEFSLDSGCYATTFLENFFILE